MKKQRKMYAFHATQRKAGAHKDKRDKRNKRKNLWKKDYE